MHKRNLNSIKNRDNISFVGASRQEGIGRRMMLLTIDF
jgi:hypothetical protein